MSISVPARHDTSTLILPLSSDAATLSRVGGKGANLAELIRAGFNVPPGFLVTTDAYRAFAAANHIGEQLLTLAQHTPANDPVALEQTSARIRTLFENGSLPSAIEAHIRAAYRQLSGIDALPVAVRSSATAEDLPGLSFAGQQDTYLNIVGADALIDAVRRCWASLWTARAIGYRARNHIPPDGVALAVVVQTMIPAEVSGVLFTANPLTGRRDEIVINASYGLGEAIVSGQVEPDHYVVRKQGPHIIGRRRGAKALAIRPAEGGGTQAVVQDASQLQALPDTQILALAQVAIRVAEHFGTPQDIEWAWADGKLYLLQSRPITSLYPLPASLVNPDDLRVYFSLNSLQGVLAPFTPIGRDVFLIASKGVLQLMRVRMTPHEALVVAGGRLYINITHAVRDRQLRNIILFMFANIDPGAREALVHLIDDGRIATQAFVTPGGVLALLVSLRTVMGGILLTWFRPAARRQQALANADRLLAAIQQRVQGATTLATRLAVMQALLRSAFTTVFPHIAPAVVPGILSQGIVDRLLTRWLRTEPGAMRRLLRGLPDNPTTEMGLALWAVAQSIDADPAARNLFLNQPVETVSRLYLHGELPSSAQQALTAFLDCYGMRGVGEIDIGNPRWREDPRSLIQMIGSYLAIDDPDLAPDRQFQQAAAEAERLTDQYVTQVRRTKGVLHARLLGLVIRRLRLLSGMREVPKFYMIKMFAVFRATLLESGRDLAAQGTLALAEDIFFVPFDTLQAFAAGDIIDLKAVVERERADYERECARRQIPRLLLSTGEVFYEGIASHNPNDLVGEGVSPGAVEGRVHVVCDPRGVRLEPGEILVCPATDPGWTPLFLSAGGLVMELGGVMTHGAVVAREYSIPAVVGIHDATVRLKDGQRIRVDGSTGHVQVLS
ncbi:MAG: phosphoenolpyruvate synthase [Anaerolineae bacterium]|nr:phosphoenolpyruvate synthase [Anaerolineae bacterium]